MPSQRNVPTNKALYGRVLQEARARFQVWPSAYASGWVVREYKRRGGRYTESSEKPSNKLNLSNAPTTPPLRRWFDEKWIDACHWALTGKVRPCARSKTSEPYPYCRPLHRLSPDTPTTVSQGSKREILGRCRIKHAQESARRAPPLLPMSK